MRSIVLSSILLIITCFKLLGQVEKKDIQHIRPAWSPKGDQFAYLSNETGKYQLYVANIRDLTPVQLTNDKATGVSQFKWSPDGESILFVSGEELKLIDSDGTDVRWIYQKQTNPFFFGWHPNGQEVTVSCPGDSGAINLCSKSLANGPLMRITTGTAQDRNFSWSPTGEYLFFGSNREGGFQLYRLATQSSSVIKRTNLPYNTIDPSCSPDGEYLSFLSDRDGNNKNFDVFIMRFDGTGLKQLSAMEGYNLPIWIPGKQELIINSNGKGFWQIFMTKENRTMLMRLGKGLAFSVSPKGEQLLVQSNEHGLNEMYVMDLAGKTKPLSQVINNAQKMNSILTNFLIR